MTFIGRRGNKYRFKVILGISEIKDVPFATGHYFFKIRLLEGEELISEISAVINHLTLTRAIQLGTNKMALIFSCKSALIARP